MSFEHQNYDPCAYDEQLKRSTGPGMYQLSRPQNDCAPCAQDIPADPFIRYQKWGAGTCYPGSSVDVGSDLWNLNRKNTKCAAAEYQMPQNPEAPNACTVPGRENAGCGPMTEPTRYSNPVCTLRDQGNNRWEWLCYDPQEYVRIPTFDWNIQYRLVAKDNHAPCIPKLIDPTLALPKPNNRSFPKYTPKANCNQNISPATYGQPFPQQTAATTKTQLNFA